jgi:hypothetical protein
MGPIRRRSHRAVTLVELIVTVAISTILLAGLTAVFVNFGRNTLVESSITEVQMDVRNALGFITDELRRARYIYNTDPTSDRFDRLRLDPVAPPAEVDPQNLSRVVFDKSRLVQAESEGFRILLAFWVPAVLGTSRLASGGAAAATRGTHLALSVRDGTLVPWGTPGSIPAYNLVVYYLTTPPPGSAWTGPRILERWESLPVAVRFDEFAEAEDMRRFLDPETVDLQTAPVVDGVYLRALPPSDDASFVLADFMDPAGVQVNYLSPQTLRVSLRGSLEGSQADRYFAGSSTAQTYLKDNAGDALGHSTTVVARNVCMPNAVCVRDP